MKNIKGQIAIEYIILISILLLFFQAIVYPNVDFSENLVTDVYNITQTKQSIDKLSLEIDSFASSSNYGKRLVYFYLPSSSSFFCDGSNIKYEIRVSPQEPRPNITACDRTSNICYFSKQLYIGTLNLTCDNIGPGYNGYLEIEKISTGDLNVKTP